MYVTGKYYFVGPAVEFFWIILKSFLSDKQYSVETSANHSEVFMSTYPNHMTLEIWVESHNKLGKVESDHLDADADWFGE